MRPPSPPPFPVGPDMSALISEMISDTPAISHTDIAARLGADPEHPFFLTDLAVARAWLGGDSIPSHRIDRLEHEQWLNVRLSIAMMSSEAADADEEELISALPIMERMEESHLSSKHLILAIQLSRLMKMISDAGQIELPIETVLRECLEADPDILSMDSDVGSEMIMKVISRSTTKEGSQRTIGTPEDHSEGETKGSMEGNSNAREGSQGEAKKSHQGDERRPSNRG